MNNRISHKLLLELAEYDPLTGEFTRKWECYSHVAPGTIMGTKHKDDYNLITLRGKRYAKSHLAWFYVHGKWPKFIVDHKNRNKADDKISNLRDATVSQNCRNRGVRSDNLYGVQGVYYNSTSRRYVANIQIKGERHQLGGFKSLFDAACARKSAENKLNFNF